MLAVPMTRRTCIGSVIHVTRGRQQSMMVALATPVPDKLCTKGGLTAWVELAILTRNFHDF
jgi:hypothetical protein